MGEIMEMPSSFRRSDRRSKKAPGMTRDAQMAPTSLRFVVGAAVGVGIVSFLATEFMHYMLVPDLGRSNERFLAEGLSAFVVSCLTAKLIQISRERHRLIMARMQVIAEMNHHIRNALTPISLSATASDNVQLVAVISDSIDRIDWALREILPRELPLPKEQREGMGYFQARRDTY
jgi:hypothetical protein